MPKNSDITPVAAKEKFNREKEICSLYIDTAKTFIQLSTGALVLSVALANDFLGGKKPNLLGDRSLIFCWLCWLLAVAVGVTYQYCVVKYLEMIASDNKMLYYERTWPLLIPKRLIENPFVAYGIMLLLFYLGIAVFTCDTALKIFCKP